MSIRHDSMPARLRLLAGLVVLAAALVAAPPSVAENAQSTEGRVSADLDETTDRQIVERLSTTFRNIDTLSGVQVRAQAGVVTLEGEVLSTESRTLAGTLAMQVEGVVAVENEIRETTSLSRRLGALAESLEERGWRFVGFVPLLVIAGIVILVFGVLAGWVRRRDRLYRSLTGNVFLQDLARQAAGLAVLGAGVLIALELLGATALVGAVLGFAGVAGLAIGFAFRDLIENYIASVLLSLRQPFAPNDHVLIEGFEGKIVRLTSRATILMTLEGNHVRIPNATVFKGNMVNFSRKPERRFDFAVGLGVNVDLSRAQALACETLRGFEGVLAEPEPEAVVEELGDSTVTLRVFGWVNQRLASRARVRSEAIRLVKEAFDRAGIDMPEPTYRLQVSNVAAEAPAAARPEPPPAAAETPAIDTSPDSHLDREIQAERAADDSDLLDPRAPTE